MRGRLWCIDAGHGGLDSGAVASSGEAERHIVLAFAKTLRERLEASGKYRVVLTRETDVFLPLTERVRIARQNQADLFISIHADALGVGGRRSAGGDDFIRSPTKPPIC